jgi:hypothetical protein
VNLQQFRSAVHIAKNEPERTEGVNQDHLFGCGTPEFKQTSTSIEAVAALIRYQALFMDGSWDEEEIESLRLTAKKKFILI